MMIESLAWPTALAVFPVAVLSAYTLGLRGRRLSFLSTFCAIFLVAVASLPLAQDLLGRGLLQEPRELSFVLVPFAAFLWLLTVIVTPSGRRNDAGLARSATACLFHMAAFLTVQPLALIGVWIATSFLFAAGNSLEPRLSQARRIAVSHLGLSTIFLILGVALAIFLRGQSVFVKQCGVALILAAVMIRKGIFPFHAWIPEIFDRGRIGPVARFSAPQIGTYVALILAVPRASPILLDAFAGLSLLTAVYGAFLALHQKDARRSCGYLFISQSALVLAGLDLPGREALIGALILWISSGLALAGLARAVLALEARRGRLNLNEFHGGYEETPQLAVSFLILCLALANFPGTLGFIGGEMLARGAAESFPTLSLLAVLAGAFNGLAALRMYFSLFCGKKSAGTRLSLGRAEGLGFAAVAAVLIGFGLAPGGLIRALSRTNVASIHARTPSEAAASGRLAARLGLATK